MIRAAAHASGMPPGRAGAERRGVWSVFREWVVRRGVIDVAPLEGGTVLVAGSARSGTTWVASAIVEALGARLVFEPFVADAELRPASLKPGPWREAGVRRGYSHYLAPGADASDPWVAGVERLLGGDVPRPWLLPATPMGVYRRRVVKAVRAGLLLAHAAARWPGMPVVWIVRDPLEVVDSQLRMRARGWDFDWSPEYALGQPALMRDWLAPYAGELERERSLTERLAVRWCVENLVPQRQLESGSTLLRLGFRDLREGEQAWSALRGHLAAHGLLQADAALDGRGSPSSFTAGRDAAARPGPIPIDQLSARDRDAVWRVVAAFGLEPLARQVGARQ